MSIKLKALFSVLWLVGPYVLFLIACFTAGFIIGLLHGNGLNQFGLNLLSTLTIIAILGGIIMSVAVWFNRPRKLYKTFIKGKRYGKANS